MTISQYLFFKQASLVSPSNYWRSKNDRRIEEGIWITKPDLNGGIGKPNLAYKFRGAF